MTDWWSVGSSIAGAAATFAATGVALWVAVRDGRQRDAERRDQEAAQARLVTFTGISDGRLLITNHSLLPISRLLVTAKVQEADGEWKFLAVRSRATVPWPGGELGPGGRVTLPVSHRMVEPGGTLVFSPLQNGESVRVTMQLLDAQGLWWERTNDQEPVRLLQPPPYTPTTPAADTADDA
ncbi:hypothetical protein ACFPH6_08775 [Streptomyces xiangluensis]|uniref:DUF4352 domain-containing protein n=1 Tax=Streptomyces xiangluensis TaxID=2665720 RepID=A0ABV8YL85_9ACTN